MVALTAARKAELVQACTKLNETGIVREIAIKEISAATAFTRTPIHPDFGAKESAYSLA